MSTGATATNAEHDTSTQDRAGRFTLVVEAGRGPLGALWIGRDATTEDVAVIRRVAPLSAAEPRARVIEAAERAVAAGLLLGAPRSSTALDLLHALPVDGESLRSLLRAVALRQGTVPPRVVAGLARGALEALGAAEQALGAELPAGGLHPDGLWV
ncbi:MAG: hypothetical protein FJ104_10795, partial [Deltaproteobacteria bacterium]|nr:hypothetical protein [Deltaproteobacteria bacterium]